MIHVVDRDSTTVECPPLQTEHVACNQCDQPDHRRLHTEHYQLGERTYQLGVNRCLACGQIYVSPRLDRDSTETVYRLDAQQTISHAYCWAGTTSDDRFEPLLNRIAELAPQGRLLDVGCGNGSFLMAAERRQRWKLIGLEPVAAAAAQARQRTDCEVVSSTLEAADGLRENEFEIVALLGVLEHLHDPAATLRRVRKLLKPEGCLAIYVPNYHYLRLKDTGLASWLRHRRWSNLSPQEHLFHFTPKLLEQLLERTGFAVHRTDVGRPFLSGSGPRSVLKQAAFAATVTLHRTTGVHLGGLEVIATPKASS